MRIDLTLCDAAGARTDVAVISRVAVPVSALVDAAPQCVASCRWAGETPIADTAIVGAAPLWQGALVAAVPRPEPRRGDTVVRVSGGPDGGTWCGLLRTPVVVGRDPDCDLVLTDPDVSRRHLVIRPGEPAPTVTDLGSTNGTRLDDTDVTANPTVIPPGSIIRLGDTFITVDRAPEPPAVQQPSADGTVRINRPLRAGIATPDDVEIVLPDTTQAAFPAQVPWLAALLPAVLGVVLALVMHSPQYLLFALLSPVLMVSTALSDRWSGRRRSRRQQAGRHAEAAAAEAAVGARLAAERATARWQWPDPATVARIAAVPTVRLWERTTRDGLPVRVGLGTVRSFVRVRDAAGSRPAGELSHHPIRVDLAAGPLGLIAPARRGARCARWLVAQLATLYSPAEVEVCVLVDDSHAARWEWVRWLPHVRGRVATSPEAARRLVDELSAERDRRHDDARAGPQQPWLVLIVDVGTGAGELPGLAGLGFDRGAHRITALCVADSEAELPGGCATVLRSDGETGTRARVVSGEGAMLEVVPDQVSAAWAETVGRSLAPYVDADIPAAGAPDTCRLPELHGCERLDTAVVREQWRQAGSGASALVGAASDGPVEFDLVRDGPHALVAGTTGAGKSELLQTWVAGLALAHPPMDLAFVLIDYKGGAAFGGCAALPHVTSLVTDLDAALTRRALRSLHAELSRRERALAEAGAADVGAYRAVGPRDPLPRLVIVVDEFAALAEELPDFVTGLIGVAQRGRSLGVHLILATQRPGGVVSPEIRANCALRVALRVLDPAESMDVLGTADAAKISPDQPGRAYVARGRSPELLQVARVTTSAPTGPVRVAPLDRWRRLLPEPAAHTGLTDLDDLVTAATAAATGLGLAPPRRPWLPPLPESMALAGLADLEDAGPSGAVAVGLVDLPEEQRQAAETLDLNAGGGELILGSARSGRSTALLGIACAAVRARGPARLQVYGLDFAGGALAWLDPLPQVGTVVHDDASAAAALLSALEERVTLRQRELTEAGRGSTAEVAAEFDAGEAGPGGDVGAKGIDAGPPALLLLLDGWEAFVRASEEFDRGASVERLTALVRAGGRVGLTVVVAGDRTACAPRLAALMRERYVLRLNDPADYAACGLRPTDVPAVQPPGRALRGSDGAEVLLAHPGATPDAAATRAAIAEAAGQISRPGAGTGREPAIVIRALPDRLALRELTPPDGTVALGCAGSDAAALYLDPVAATSRLLVAGPPRSGRSTFLQLLIAQRQRVRLPIVVAAPDYSPARRDAEAVGLAWLHPDSPPADITAALRTPALLLVDDSESFLDTPAGEALQAYVRSRPDLAVVLTGRSDELLVTFRGLVAEVRRHRCALLLQPSATDLELIGERPARLPPITRAGRGLMRGNPQVHPAFARGPVPIQVALP